MAVEKNDTEIIQLLMKHDKIDVNVKDQIQILIKLSLNYCC